MRPSRPLWIASIAAVAATLLLLLLAACGDDGAPAGGSGSAPAAATTPPATTAPSTTTVPQAVAAEVFFVRAERVSPAVRQVTAPAVARGAMRALLQGPDPSEQADGMSTSIPAATELLGLRIVNGVAEVDLSGAFASGGGSLSMLTRVAQVVYTLTGFSTVRSVRFLIDGRRVDSIGGEGVIVDRPLTRADLADQAPATGS